MIPILAYHQIVDDDFDVNTAPVGDRPYCLEESAFREQMDYLTQQRYTVLSLNQLMDNLHHKTESPEQTVVITFDDGHISNYTRALPILLERAMTATFFIVTSRVGESDWLNGSQMRELQQRGMTIGSHTVSHPFLSQLGVQEVRWELEQSKKTLENELGTPIAAFAVPYGYEPAGLEQIAKECGYRAVCNSRLGLVNTRANILRLPRVTIRRGCSLETFARLVQGNSVTLFKLKALETIKNAGKRGLGLHRWLAVREFLLKARGPQ
jgi:peptidoglycan/xylan/chitin deacetylase (PgdA/CDA1 family)